MTEKKYTFDLKAMGERTTEEMLSGKMKVHATPTGVIQLTLYGNPGNVRVNLAVEIQCDIEVLEGGVRRFLTPTTRTESLGGVGIDLMGGSYPGLLVGRMATWLSQGYVAGPAVPDAVWDVLWYILKTHKQMRDRVAEFYPKWIKNLGVGKPKE